MEMKKTLDSKKKEKVKRYEDAIKRAENCTDSDYKNIREIDGHQRLITTLLEDLQNSYYNGYFDKKYFFFGLGLYTYITIAFAFKTNSLTFFLLLVT